MAELLQNIANCILNSMDVTLSILLHLLILRQQTNSLGFSHYQHGRQHTTH